MTPETRHRTSESGSAYIIALLVLVVLSILGIALSLISQSEMQIGANELTSHRALYGADGGVNLAIARVLTVNSSVDNATITAVTPMAFTIPESRFTYNAAGDPVPYTPPDGSTHFAERVSVSPFVPIHEQSCDGCQAAIGDITLETVQHAVVATAQRITWNGNATPTATQIADAPRTAQKELYMMIGLAPFWKPKWESIADANQVSKIVQTTMGTYSN
ncbi:MAG TPA: PilX N-terminal domain-containing pilus assembly protein [Thermoanaerobaculia bacterium]|jgi:hypothetical protein|nr:PilX N-terminal domain-containing pilus assembly protein [Thermoanaerobaculia bacterium]